MPGLISNICLMAPHCNAELYVPSPPPSCCCCVLPLSSSPLVVPHAQAAEACTACPSLYRLLPSLMPRQATEAYLLQILKHGFYHADPHPGNQAVDITPGPNQVGGGRCGEV